MIKNAASNIQCTAHLIENFFMLKTKMMNSQVNHERILLFVKEIFVEVLSWMRFEMKINAMLLI